MNCINKILCFILLIVFTSCITKVDEVFDTTSSERLETQLKECKDLLINSDNGWLIRYYPSSDSRFGGYNIVARFEEDGNVNILSDLASDMGEIAKSHYSLLSSNGATLSFDTYNKYLHYFSDPDYWNGNDLGGDFEWIFMGGDEEELEFRSIKTGNTIIFSAIKENMITQLSKIVSIKKSVEPLFNYSYEWNDGSGTVITLLHENTNNAFKYYPGGNTSGEYVIIPFIYTDKGIQFYKEVSINNIKVRQFAHDASIRGYTSLDAVTGSGEEVTVTLKGSIAPDFVHYDRLLGDWKLYYIDNRSISVSIKENERNKSYTMSGLDYDVAIAFDKTGISITPQIVSNDSEDRIYFCMWAIDVTKGTGPVFITGAMGMNLTFNGNDSNPSFTFVDNGISERGKVNSFLFYDYTNQTPEQQIPFVTRLVK